MHDDKGFGRLAGVRALTDAERAEIFAALLNEGDRRAFKEAEQAARLPDFPRGTALKLSERQYAAAEAFAREFHARLEARDLQALLKPSRAPVRPRHPTRQR